MKRILLDSSLPKTLTRYVHSHSMAVPKTAWKPKTIPPSWNKLPDYDRGWIAALIDGEGCLSITKTGYPRLQIWNTNRRFLERAQILIGGSLHEVPMSKLSKKRVYCLTLWKTLLLWLLPQVELINKERMRKVILQANGIKSIA